MAYAFSSFFSDKLRHHDITAIGHVEMCQKIAQRE